MKDVVVHRLTSAPRDAVWAVATDLEAAPRHLSGVESVELLTPGPFGVGTRWRETRTMFGRATTEEMVVTAVDEGRSYVVEADSGGAHYVSTFTFEPVVEGGTSVTMAFGAQPTSALGRVLGLLTAPLARRAVAKAVHGDLDDLVRAAEERGTPPGEA